MKLPVIGRQCNECFNWKTMIISSAEALEAYLQKFPPSLKCLQLRRSFLASGRIRVFRCAKGLDDKPWFTLTCRLNNALLFKHRLFCPSFDGNPDNVVERGE